MSQRVIVHLEPDTDVKPIKTALEAAGAESVRGPALELPDVLIVTIPNDQNINEFIRKAQEVPGVRYAEPDSWQFTA
jgi:cell division protein FtsX